MIESEFTHRKAYLFAKAIGLKPKYIKESNSVFGSLTGNIYIPIFENGTGHYNNLGSLSWAFLDRKKWEIGTRYDVGQKLWHCKLSSDTVSSAIESTSNILVYAIVDAIIKSESLPKISSKKEKWLLYYKLAIQNFKRGKK